MAEEGETQGTETQEPNGTGAEVDWKARYDELLKHSRENERRAKANKAAAEELEQLKASQTSEDEKRAKEVEDLRAENERYRMAEQRRGWVASVSSETGVPADVLAMFECSDEADLRSKAEAVADKFKAETVPVVSGDGIRPESQGGAKRDFLRETLPANLRR